MIITDLSYLESASEVIGDLRGGIAFSYGSALAQANSRSGLAFTNTNIKTVVVNTPFVAVAVAAGSAEAIAIYLPSLV